MKKIIDETIPKTIKELEQWTRDHYLPSSEETRFFIGEKYKSIKAYGIYQDSKTGKYIVYHNKGNGERSIYYESDDEELAVSKIYYLMRERFVDKKSIYNILHNDYFSIGLGCLIMLLLVVGVSLLFVYGFSAPKRGYYYINEEEYYYVNNHWFVYEDNDWIKTKKPNYSGNISNCYDGSDYYGSSYYTDIRQSDVYNKKWDDSNSYNDYDFR